MYYYSALNRDMTSGSIGGYFNIMQNQFMTQAQTNSIINLVPTINFDTFYQYPMYAQFGNNLLNPMLAMQQTMQAFQNGSWMNNNNGNWFNNNNWMNPFNPTNNNNSNTGNYPEYTALKNLITKYKEIGTKNYDISDSLLKEINDALNKSGTQEEKMNALKEVYKKLKPSLLQKTLLEVPEIKISLDKIGYNFKGSNKEEDTKLKKELNNVENDIKAENADKLALLCSTENEPRILRIVSYWNDTRNGDENRGIIRLVAKNIPSTDSEKTNHIEAINNLAMSLVNKVEDLKAELDGQFPKLDAAQKEVQDALTAATKDPANFTESKLNALADKFDTLYAMLRMIEAQKVRNEIAKKYSFTNDISSSDKKLINNDLIVKETIADLGNEGIKVSDITTDEVADIEEVEEVVEVEEEEIEDEDIDTTYNTAEEKMNALVEGNNLKETTIDGVYTTNAATTNEPARFYTIKDGKIVELKNVKSIKANGKVEMVNGAEKDVNEVQSTEVTAEDIKTYNTTVVRVNKLVKNGTLTKVNTSTMTEWPEGVTLYQSKGKQEYGEPQYFIVRNNKLVKIALRIDTNGQVCMSSTRASITDLGDEWFEEIEDSDIVTEDLKALKEKEAEAAKKAKEEKYNKEFEKHEVKEAEEIGKDIAKDLMGITNQREWNNASDRIYEIDGENVYSVIKAYAEEEGWGTDHIIQQIGTENDREAADKQYLINHIIKKTLEYCEKYGSKSPRAYKDLEENYANGIGVEDATNVETLKKIDSLILRVFGIRG